MIAVGRLRHDCRPSIGGASGAAASYQHRQASGIAGTASGAPSEPVPGRIRSKFEIADVVSEPESKPSADRHYDHLLIAGRKCRHAEASYDISGASEAVELLIDRVNAWQVAAWRRSIPVPPIADACRWRTCTSLRTKSEHLFPHLKVRCGRQKGLTNDFKIKNRGCRGSDPRLLRLTMDTLLDRHIWGATPCIKDRQRPRSDLPDVMWAWRC
jgi:hypothetical protein